MIRYHESWWRVHIHHFELHIPHCFIALGIFCGDSQDFLTGIHITWSVHICPSFEISRTIDFERYLIVIRIFHDRQKVERHTLSLENLERRCIDFRRSVDPYDVYLQLSRGVFPLFVGCLYLYDHFAYILESRLECEYRSGYCSGAIDLFERDFIGLFIFYKGLQIDTEFFSLVNYLNRQFHNGFFVQQCRNCRYENDRHSDRDD